MQLTSPRPYILKHSHKPGVIVQWWIENLNDAVAVQTTARSERLREIGALPQLSGDRLRLFSTRWIVV